MRWCDGSRQGNGGENRDVVFTVAVTKVCNVQLRCTAYR